MAGISGTGKSQLPRLYAEATGMHFLSVAVQPRWDSPQDLFGFYNYMEHRYKATELARAIRQMDHAWPPKSMGLPHKTDGEQRIQEGVLLVLLDEMNLARVEYYFSELLSKLEMRNATGEDEARQRLLMAIEIETGSLRRQEESCRLFVGHNVLFVGTMNEDETTQSLSDKVIDRANMLRFGNPGVLQKEKPPHVDPLKEYLSYFVWQSWQRAALPKEHDDHFVDLSSRLNAALTKISRPFGHRVHQAMYRYLANYPRDGNWFEAAFADQLEQKIVPKLRGLSRDTDDAAAEVLTEIGDVIRQTNDQGLEGAFQVARERPVFQWSGINREAD